MDFYSVSSSRPFTHGQINHLICMYNSNETTGGFMDKILEANNEKEKRLSQ